MRRVLWFFGWAGVAIWSLFSFAVYGVVNVIGEAAMRNADMFSDDPETVEGVWKLFSWLHSLSTSVTLVIWGLVTLAILSVPWLFDRLSVQVRPVGPAPRPPDGIIDLPASDYVVHPGDPSRADAMRSGTASGGTVPRIGPVPPIGPWRT